MAQSFPSGGMIEYIVSQEYARKVLTEESSFSFECGMEEVRCPHIFFPKRWLLTLVKILGIQWMRYIHGGTFFRDVDSVVRELSTKKLRSIAKETWPVFELGVSELLNTVQDEKPVDILPHVKRIMAQATIRILLGPTYQNEEDVNRILDISADVAELMGLRRHESRMAHKYPRLWRTLTFAVIIVWVTYFLAIHPDCQKSIRDEAESLVRSEMSGSGSEYKALQDATLVDSFVREVLRMKGDTVNAVRVAVRDVELAGHRIPKGTPVFPVTYLSNRSPALIADPDKFDAKRWIGTGKSATTAGQDYLAFGLGRWSCPGRFLAVMGEKFYTDSPSWSWFDAIQ
ncbi:hypothetical protein BN1708_003845 [Verticillium longisporum]|uniref:Cytochrome P450 n=1 Tax=Verticillium longisporum TaxID=100787 RepID=A0A0G4LRU5_VERLO|nr:hypothetical protein BN1708_003845 [Verticillium longisporum]